MPRLRRVDCSVPGIRRVRRGRGFSYQEEDGTTIADREVLERINELAIPPAWKDVWICPHPNGHIQATGIDDAGRKQYLYHPQWRENRDREKFAEMERFAKALPAMRERTPRPTSPGAASSASGCSPARCGCSTSGSSGSAASATRRRTRPSGSRPCASKHVEVERGVAVFDYTAKGVERHRQEIADPVVVPTIKALKDARRRRPRAARLPQRPQRLGRRQGGRDQRLPEGGDGRRLQAKDFRTWNATVLAAVELATNGTARRPRRRRASERATAATKRVADYLSNTPAVCRSAYIDPRVFDRYDSGETIRAR